MGNFIIVRSAKAIQRCFRWYAQKTHKIKSFYQKRLGVVVAPIESKVETSKLAELIYQLYMGFRVRRFHWYRLNRNVVHSQRIVRGFLARTICRRLIGLRDALRSWVNPQYANEYMRNFLSSKASLGALGLGLGGHSSIQKLDQLVSGIDRSALISAASASHPVSSRRGTANGSTPLGDPPDPFSSPLDWLYE